MELVPRHTDLPLLFKHPAAFAHRYRWSLIALFVAAVADAATTLITVRRYGPGTEVHPVQQLVLRLLGTAVGVPVAKVVQVAFVLLVAAWWRPWCRWVLLVCSALYLMAAISNHFMLL